MNSDNALFNEYLKVSIDIDIVKIYGKSPLLNHGDIDHNMREVMSQVICACLADKFYRSEFLVNELFDMCKEQTLAIIKNIKEDGFL